MAKADLNPIETWRSSVGQAIHRCFALARLSQKEAAALIGREPAQIARWINGQERPQFDAIFAVDCLRHPLILALAEIAGSGVKIRTEISIERTA